MISKNLVAIGLAVMLLLTGYAAFSNAPARGLSPTQGWDDATLQRYHYESQGTRFMPAAILEALRTPGGRFMEPANLRKFGFIFDDTHANTPEHPYAWPIGLAIDRDSSGIEMAGFTCAACHTAQIHYRGATLQIEGGAADIDVAAFRRALAAAVIFSGSDPERRAAIETRAVALGFPRDRIGPAFDRTVDAMAEAAKSPPEYVTASTPGGPGRLDALNAIATAIFSTDLGVPKNAKVGDAPVRFPYLWDIWRFDWVQYNASVRQPMDRNIGEALGVGIATHFVDPVTGAANPEPLRWKSSVRVRSLRWIEDALSRLQAPVWPQHILGRIDPVKAAEGADLFANNCARCHAVQEIAGTAPTEWHVPVVPLEQIGTDPRQARDYAKHRFDASKLGLATDVRTPVGLAFVVEEIKRQAYTDARIPKAQWPQYDGFGRTTSTFPAPCGYKARPLIGVWATGPFLHNGSVPTIYDLLSESRPAKFWFGSEEFDPVHLGFTRTETPGAMLFDTHLPGNSNAGHWFTGDRTRRGRIGPALSEAQKYAIIEYLKSATAANYPRFTIRTVPDAPCETQPAWADAATALR
jgi:hypothetical protein